MKKRILSLMPVTAVLVVAGFWQSAQAGGLTAAQQQVLKEIRDPKDRKQIENQFRIVNDNAESRQVAELVKYGIPAQEALDALQRFSNGFSTDEVGDAIKSTFTGQLPRAVSDHQSECIYFQINAVMNTDITVTQAYKDQFAQSRSTDYAKMSPAERKLYISKAFVETDEMRSWSYKPEAEKAKLRDIYKLELGLNNLPARNVVTQPIPSVSAANTPSGTRPSPATLRAQIERDAAFQRAFNYSVARTNALNMGRINNIGD